MNIKTIINVIKVVGTAATVIPPVISGAKVLVKTTSDVVKNRMEKSEKIKDIKKDFELRKEGVITVDYTEV